MCYHKSHKTDYANMALQWSTAKKTNSFEQTLPA